VRGAPDGNHRLPFLDTLMPIFDENKDGLLKIDEVNRSLAAMRSTAREQLTRLRSLGLYSFNSSSSRSSSLPPGSPTAVLDSIDLDGNS
jgi:hypothetical protein